MPDLTISELKRALVEVKKICQNTSVCEKCPFCELPHFGCRLDIFPYSWFTAEWEVDFDDVRSREM